jgi:hypothetical protein
MQRDFFKTHPDHQVCPVAGCVADVPGRKMRRRQKLFNIWQSTAGFDSRLW